MADQTPDLPVRFVLMMTERDILKTEALPGNLMQSAEGKKLP